jgi:hypothetical protein
MNLFYKLLQLRQQCKGRYLTRVRTAFFTVVYPSCAPFLREFVSSLNSQTDHDFELCIANDGMESLEAYLSALAPTIGRNSFDLSGSFAEIRIAAISRLKNEGYDSIIFGDADDVFSPNRIRSTKEMLLTRQIVFNDLLIFEGHFKGSGISMLNERFKEGRGYVISDIREFNFIGLSNSALNLEIVTPAHLKMSKDLQAFDWTFFSKLMLSGNSAYFLPNAVTYYRLRDNNFANLSRVNHDSLINLVRIKQMHYNELSKFDSWFEKHANLFTQLLNEISEDKQKFENYLGFVRQHMIERPLWWEIARLP